ncbi:hypothetical protein BsWGS_15990 [Bradybaena similaris]
MFKVLDKCATVSQQADWETSTGSRNMAFRKTSTGSRNMATGKHLLAVETWLSGKHLLAAETSLLGKHILPVETWLLENIYWQGNMASGKTSTGSRNKSSWKIYTASGFWKNIYWQQKQVFLENIYCQWLLGKHLLVGKHGFWENIYWQQKQVFLENIYCQWLLGKHLLAAETWLLRKKYTGIGNMASGKTSTGSRNIMAFEKISKNIIAFIAHRFPHKCSGSTISK